MEFFQVQHIMSSPHFPQSNGFAEAMVKIAKKFMDHSTLQEKPWNFGLMEYRCNPLTGKIPSPLELLTGQKPMTGLPSIPWGNSTTRQHHEALIKKKQMYISQELPISSYEPGQMVWCFDTLKKDMEASCFLSQLPNHTHTGVGWKIPTRNSEEQDLSSHVWIQWSARKNRCFPAHSWKKTPSYNLHQLWIGMNL